MGENVCSELENPRLGRAWDDQCRQQELAVGVAGILEFWPCRTVRMASG